MRMETVCTKTNKQTNMHPSIHPSTPPHTHTHTYIHTCIHTTENYCKRRYCGVRTNVLVLSSSLLSTKDLVLFLQTRIYPKIHHLKNRHFWGVKIPCFADFVMPAMHCESCDVCLRPVSICHCVCSVEFFPFVVFGPLLCDTAK
jgi:hypothetical protein